MWVTMWRPPSATFCFATLSLLAPLLCASFGLIIFGCLYTHLNHFTVILLMANFKLLPHGRRRKITTTCCCGFSSIFRVLRGACPTLLYDSYCSAENHSYIYSSLQFALFFGPGPKSIRLIHYLLNFSVSRPKNFHFINWQFVMSLLSFSIIYLLLLPPTPHSRLKLLSILYTEPWELGESRWHSGSLHNSGAGIKIKH